RRCRRLFHRPSSDAAFRPGRRVGTRARYDNSLPEPIWRRVVRALAVPPIPPAHGVPPPRSGANPVAQVWLFRNASRIGGVARWQRFRGRRGGVATALREKKARWRRNQVGVRGAGVGNRSCTPGATLRRSESTIRVVMSTKTEVLPAEAWLRIDAEAEVQAIAEAVRSQLTEMLKRRGLVVAMSGGVDSSVAAGLAVRAVGPKRVFG